jgi:hypothetical protein
MLDTLLRGVSTRNCKDVIPQMAETVGVPKSSVRRQVIEGMLHYQLAWHTALAASLSGSHQHHRESARRSVHPNPSRHKLAKWLDGEALHGLGLPANREELP